jgi:hypothetical protein
MQKPEASHTPKRTPTKRRRHAYRGYGSPSWEEDRDRRGHWGRWSGGVLLPEAGILIENPRTGNVRNGSLA